MFTGLQGSRPALWDLVMPAIEGALGALALQVVRGGYGHPAHVQISDDLDRVGGRVVWSMHKFRRCMADITYANARHYRWFFLGGNFRD